MDPCVPVIKILRIGGKIIRVTAIPLFPDCHHHIFKIHPYQPSQLKAWLASHHGLLPNGLGVRILRRVIPEYLLPTSLILKECNPAQPETRFHELAMYRYLEAKKTPYVPRFFGKATVVSPFDGSAERVETPALLLEFIPGVPLSHKPPDAIANSRGIFEALQGDDTSPDEPLARINNPLLYALRSMYDALTYAGVVHGDPDPGNFIVNASGDIIAIDFENAELTPCDNTNVRELRRLVDELLTLVRYRCSESWRTLEERRHETERRRMDRPGSREYVFPTPPPQQSTTSP